MYSKFKINSKLNKIITELKPPKSRDTLDLLELVCQLHSRGLAHPSNRDLHNAYVEAREEMERRIKINNNFVLADVSRQSEILFEFIKAIKEEFKEENWKYIDLIADRVISELTNKK